MKKVFFLIATAMLSVSMWAGEKDLIWDFSDAAPSSNPEAAQNNAEVKLYYGSSIKDGITGDKNRLNGVKLNDGGYAYFTKEAVKGKLKLGYGPRSGSNKANIDVYTWTGAATPAPAKTEMTFIGTTKEMEEYGTAEIELTEAQNNIYLCRHNGVETGLQLIQFKEFIPRDFVDFKIDFRSNPYKLLAPEGGSLPEGVTIAGTYHDDQHGYGDAVVTVKVDGPVKFTVGTCQYTNKNLVVKNSKNETIADMDLKSGGCDSNTSFEHSLAYTYTSGADVLTLSLGQYCPFLYAEACEITPCDVIFKDQNGNVLGKVATIEGALLEAIPYTEADLPAISKSEAFRGWFYSNNKKAKAGDVISGNTTIQAKVTPIEYATVGSVQTYDFADPTYYPEDHETVEVNGGAYYNNHGWLFAADGSIKVKVGGNAIVNVTLCQYSESGDVVVKAGEKEIGKASVEKNTTPDGTEFAAKYEGEAGELTISWTAKQYIHKVVVYNVLDFLEKDPNTGYYIVPANDAASFLLALVQANSEGDAKIFLPNGLYDLGESVLTSISGNNIAIIGQSMTGVIIKNAPPAAKESIDKTATLKINKNVQGTYLQDLTIQNALDYYKNDNGRAVALWDQGTKTICKNVRLLSYQDTYYSNLQGAVKYFEDCEIHGTVDFICGDGSVYFKNNLLYCEKRQKSGGGSDALTANNGIESDRGYVFESCVIQSECPVVSFGRAWNNKPTTTFLNTTVDYSKGNFSFSDGNKVERWTKDLMNANAWPRFGEYNTRLESGELLTPEHNVVTFVDPKSGNATQQIETVLSAEQAATFTMAYTLGDWAETAANDAKQAIAEKEAAEFEADGIYLVEKDGEFAAIIHGNEFMSSFAIYDGANYTVRKANKRGGFGPVSEEKPNAISEITEQGGSKTHKFFRDGQVIIVRDNKEYNVLGAQL